MSSDSNEDANSSIPDSQAEYPEPTRPNRWTGASATWASLTEQERGLAASLDQIRNGDLSVHLFNAFALKKRARDAGYGAQVRFYEMNKAFIY
jgi:RNA polymerase I specific transcription initiation factor